MRVVEGSRCGGIRCALQLLGLPGAGRAGRPGCRCEAGEGAPLAEPASLRCLFSCTLVVQGGGGPQCAGASVGCTQSVLLFALISGVASPRAESLGTDARPPPPPRGHGAGCASLPGPAHVGRSGSASVRTSEKPTPRCPVILSWSHLSQAIVPAHT